MSDIWVLVVVALPLVALWLYMFVEVLVRDDVSSWRRVLWGAAFLLIPIGALAVYVVARPPKPVRSERGDSDTARAEQIVEAAEARQRGDIDDAEYRARIDAVVA